MKYVFLFSVLISIIFGSLKGNINAVSESLLSGCSEAVNLGIALCGTICFWSGIMNIADKSGITKIIAKAFSPAAKRIFKNIPANSQTINYIILNITSNFLGLGNAATPTGIKAMKLLAENDKADGVATGNMIRFALFNTASIQFFPATIAAIRIKYGSNSPLDILPCIWIVSVICLCITLLCEKIFSVLSKRKTDHGIY